MHTNQVESPGLVCLGRGDGLKNCKKMRFARSGPFSLVSSLLFLLSMSPLKMVDLLTVSTQSTILLPTFILAVFHLVV